jgi:4'-phosphopantetheinyl transferase
MATAAGSKQHATSGTSDRAFVDSNVLDRRVPSGNPPGDAWAPAPSRVPPLGSDVHVWRVDVPRWLPRVPALRRLLAPDERARADRFRSEADTHRLVIGRGVLRLLIGELLHLLPEQLAFTYSASGKPSITGVEFNVAHSGDVILVATHQYRIGVDVERVGRTVDVVAMGRACFTPRERALIHESSATQETFYRLWTRKEAWLKAVGAGLSFPLRRVDVADAAAPAIAPGAAIDGAPPSRIVDLPVEPEYVAACAVSAPDCRLRLWRVEETWRHNHAALATVRDP